MNKILTALIAGLFAASINVYAADAAAPAAPADAAAKTDAAAPAVDAGKDKKADHKKHGKKADAKK